MRGLTLTALVVITLSSHPTTSAQSAGLVDLGVTVVNGVTREPIGNADVTIRRVTSAIGSSDAADSGFGSGAVLSSHLGNPTPGRAPASGRAAFPVQPAGWYRVDASKNGWTAGSYGQDRPDPFGDLADLTSPGHHEIEVPLWPSSSITCTVTDDDDRPVPDAIVRVLQKQPAVGEWRWFAVSDQKTDLNGVARLELTSGTYFVVVTPKSVSRSSDDRLIVDAFLPMAYPRAHIIRQAQSLELLPGADRAIDMRLVTRDLVTVSGKLHAPNGDGVASEIRLVPILAGEAAPDPLTIQTVSAANGTFSFAPVPPGDYRIQVAVFKWNPEERPSTVHVLWTDTPVSASRVGVLSGLDVWLHESFTLKGRIEVVSSGALATVPKLEGQVAFLRADSRPGGYNDLMPTPVGATFLTGPMAPGRYRAIVQMSSAWRDQEIWINGRDMTGTPFHIDADSTDIVIRVSTSDLHATLDVKVTGIDRDGCSGHNCWLAIFPADVATGDGYWSRVPPIIRLTPEPTLTWPDLPAGDYWVAVTGRAQVRGWPDADVLKKLVPFATRVTVKGGQSTHVELTYRPH
jgi:hypothetical protein